MATFLNRWVSSLLFLFSWQGVMLLLLAIKKIGFFFRSLYSIFFVLIGCACFLMPCAYVSYVYNIIWAWYSVVMLRPSVGIKNIVYCKEKVIKLPFLGLFCYGLILFLTAFIYSFPLLLALLVWLFFVYNIESNSFLGSLQKATINTGIFLIRELPLVGLLGCGLFFISRIEILYPLVIVIATTFLTLLLTKSICEENECYDYEA